MGQTIRIHQALRHLTNNQSAVEVDGKTVGKCLAELVERFPGMKPKLFGTNGKLLSYVDIYVNAESSYPEELDKAVNDGDTLSVTIIIAGG